MSAAGGSHAQLTAMSPLASSSSVSARAAHTSSNKCSSTPATGQHFVLPRPVVHLLEEIVLELKKAEARQFDNADCVRAIAHTAGVAVTPRPCGLEVVDLEKELLNIRCGCEGALVGLLRRLSGFLTRAGQLQWWTQEALWDLRRQQRLRLRKLYEDRLLACTRATAEAAAAEEEQEEERSESESAIEEVEEVEEIEEVVQTEKSTSLVSFSGDESASSASSDDGSSSSSSSTSSDETSSSGSTGAEEDAPETEEAAETEESLPHEAVPEWTLTDAERLYDELRYGIRRR